MAIIELVEELTIHEQFRLIEIAHETKNYEIRDAALAMLKPHVIEVRGEPGEHIELCNAGKSGPAGTQAEVELQQSCADNFKSLADVRVVVRKNPDA